MMKTTSIVNPTPNDANGEPQNSPFTNHLKFSPNQDQMGPQSVPSNPFLRQHTHQIGSGPQQSIKEKSFDFDPASVYKSRTDDHAETPREPIQGDKDSQNLLFGLQQRSQIKPFKGKMFKCWQFLPRNRFKTAFQPVEKDRVIPERTHDFNDSFGNSEFVLDARASKKHSFNYKSKFFLKNDSRRSSSNTKEYNSNLFNEVGTHSSFNDDAGKTSFKGSFSKSKSEVSANEGSGKKQKEAVSSSKRENSIVKEQSRVSGKKEVKVVKDGTSLSDCASHLTSNASNKLKNSFKFNYKSKKNNFTNTFPKLFAKNTQNKKIKLKSFRNRFKHLKKKPFGLSLRGTSLTMDKCKNDWKKKTIGGNYKGSLKWSRSNNFSRMTVSIDKKGKKSTLEEKIKKKLFKSINFKKKKFGKMKSKTQEEN